MGGLFLLLEGLEGLEGLDGLDALDGLDGLDGLEGLDALEAVRGLRGEGRIGFGWNKNEKKKRYYGEFFGRRW